MQGGHDPDGPGGIYFVDVFERQRDACRVALPVGPQRRDARAGEPDRPAGRERPGARQPTCSNDGVAEVAAAVALRRLGYKVVAKPSGVLVAAVAPGSQAAGSWQPSDLIVAVERHATPRSRLRARLASAPGDDGHARERPPRRTARSRSRRSPTDAQAARDRRLHARAGGDDRAALKVQIDAGNVGGPSAGLAFALEVMEELGHDVDHGYRVAATGEIELERRRDADRRHQAEDLRRARGQGGCLPRAAGDNAADARRYADGLRIIAVKSFPQALQALATLPPKALGNASFGSVGNCRKFVSFRPRQRLPRAKSAL